MSIPLATFKGGRWEYTPPRQSTFVHLVAELRCFVGRDKVELAFMMREQISGSDLASQLVLYACISGKVTVIVIKLSADAPNWPFGSCLELGFDLLQTDCTLSIPTLAEVRQAKARRESVKLLLLVGDDMQETEVRFGEV